MNKWLFRGIVLAFLWVRASAGAGEPVRPVVNRDYLPAVLELINGATNSIEFLQLEMHDDRAVQAIEAALAAAVKRGVRVRGMLDDGVDFNAAAVERLHALGAEAKLDTPVKMTHSKLVVVDGRVVLLGSTNWTGNSMGNNNETNVRLDDPVLAAQFARYVAAVWADSAAEPDLPPVESGAVKTVVNRQYFPEVMGLFSAATQRIRVVMYGINYSPKYAGSKVNQLVEALAAARARGVDVAVVIDLSDYNALLNKVNAPAKRFLAEAGAVKTLVNRQYFPEVMNLFNAATQRIRVVMYGISYSPKYAGGKVNQLVEALAAARARGVDVAVIIDLSDYNALLNKVNRPAKEFLAGAGVAVFDDPAKTTTHAKLIVADDVAVVGSVNWGKDALETRNETCVAVRDAAVADAFAAYFDRPDVRAAPFAAQPAAQ